MKSVSRCIWDGQSVIAQAKDHKDVDHRVFLQDVRAGIVFPTGGLPGYYVLFGRKTTKKSTDNPTYMYLTEDEHLRHERLFDSFTDACVKFKCRTVYAKIERQDRHGGIGGYDDLWRYVRAKKLTKKQRSEIARKAAKTRWIKQQPK